MTSIWSSSALHWHTARKREQIFDVLHCLGNESHCGIWPTRYAWNFLLFFPSNTKSKRFTRECYFINQHQGESSTSRTLILPPLDKKCTTTYANRSFIILFTTVLHPYPESDQSSPRHLILFLQDPFLYYPPIYVLVFHVSSFF